MKWILNLLKTFDYDTFTDFARSLLPSLKYQLMLTWVTLSGVSTLLQRVFGLDAVTLIVFVAIVLVELLSGIRASQVKKQEFSSMRLSRFSLKMACYLVMIALPYVLAQNFTAQGKAVPAEIFEWLHTFLVVQIAFENIISVLENLSTIDGKDKTFYIDKLRSFISKKLTP